MKRLSFITVCLLAVALTDIVQAQDVKFTASPVTYSEEYWESSGKLISKIWRSGNNTRSESIDRFNGKTIVIIMRQDSAKGFVLDMEKKTYKAVPLSMFTNQKEATNNVVGLDIVKESNTDKKFIKEEEVEGYPCKLYEIKTTSMMKNGGQSVDYFVNEWIYEPFNLWIRQKELPYEPSKIRRNIKTDPQPESLFEIPKDFKGMTLPTGGLMEMLTGKPKEQNQQDADKAQKGFEELGDKMKEIEKNPDKNQQMQDMLQLLNESQKKKQK
jgi:hypothetical protein